MFVLIEFQSVVNRLALQVQTQKNREPRLSVSEALDYLDSE